MTPCTVNNRQHCKPLHQTSVLLPKPKVKPGQAGHRGLEYSPCTTVFMDELRQISEVAVVPPRALNRKESLCPSLYVSFSIWRTLPSSFWSTTKQNYIKRLRDKENHRLRCNCHWRSTFNKCCQGGFALRSTFYDVHGSCNFISQATTLTVRRQLSQHQEFNPSTVSLKSTLNLYLRSVGSKSVPPEANSFESYLSEPCGNSQASDVILMWSFRSVCKDFCFF